MRRRAAPPARRVGCAIARPACRSACARSPPASSAPPRRPRNCRHHHVMPHPHRPGGTDMPDTATLILRAVAEVAPDADVSAIDPAADLAEQLELDSMDFLNIVAAVDEATGVDIPEQ